MGDVRERGEEVKMRKIMKEDFLGGLGESEREMAHVPRCQLPRAYNRVAGVSSVGTTSGKSQV